MQETLTARGEVVEDKKYVNHYRARLHAWHKYEQKWRLVGNTMHKGRKAAEKVVNAFIDTAREREAMLQSCGKDPRQPI